MLYCGIEKKNELCFDFFWPSVLRPHPDLPQREEGHQQHSPYLYKIHHFFQSFFAVQLFFEPHKDIGHIENT